MLSRFEVFMVVTTMVAVFRALIPCSLL